MCCPREIIHLCFYKFTNESSDKCYNFFFLESRNCLHQIKKIIGNMIISCILLLPVLAACPQEYKLYRYALSTLKNCAEIRKKFELIILRKVMPAFHSKFCSWRNLLQASRVLTRKNTFFPKICTDIMNEP